MAAFDSITSGVTSAVQGVAETVARVTASQAGHAAKVAIRAVPEPQGERRVSGKRVLAVLVLGGLGLYVVYRMGWLGKRKYRGRR